VERHLALAAAQEEVDHRRARELRRAAEAAVLAVVARRTARPPVERAGVELAGAAVDARGARQPGDDLLRARDDLLALRAPGLRDGRQHLRPGGRVLARCGGKYVPA
jgi:hypothetical protein